MPQPTYRCVECSQPAPAGQLLCAACTARIEARKQPSQQPPQLPSQLPYQPPPSAYPASHPSSPSPVQAVTPTQNTSVYRGVSLPSDTLPPQAQAPPDMPAHYRLDLSGKPMPDISMPDTPAPAAAFSMPPGTPYLPQNPGGNTYQGQYGRATTDPDALLAQLKQAEGGKYPLPGGNTFAERFASRVLGRLALRAGVGVVLGLFVVITRFTGGAHSNSAAVQTPDTDTPTQRVAARPAASANGIAAARNSLQAAATPIAFNAESQDLRAAIGRVNDAWSDVKNVLFSAGGEGMRTDRPPDYRPFIQPLERDYQIIKQALEVVPLREHEQCVHMMRAIETAQNELLRLSPRPAATMPGSNPNQGAPEVPALNNTAAVPPAGGGSAPANGVVPTGQPTGQPAPQESGMPPAQGSASGSASGSGQPADNTLPPGASPQGTPANPGQGLPPSSSPPGSPPPLPGGSQNP